MQYTLSVLNNASLPHLTLIKLKPASRSKLGLLKENAIYKPKFTTTSKS